MVSEMKKPQHAMRAAYTLQSFATTYYAVFAAVVYVYIGNSVASPAFSSLEPKWQKAAYGIAIPNFLIAGSLYAHTASKLVFVRLFRHSRHLHSHTVLGWGTWAILILIMNGCAFVLAVGVPIFNYLIGIAASLFAAWFVSNMQSPLADGLRCADLRLDIWHSRHVLAARCVPHRGRLLHVDAEVVPVDACARDSSHWGLHMRGRHVCDRAVDCGGI